MLWHFPNLPLVKAEKLIRGNSLVRQLYFIRSLSTGGCQIPSPAKTVPVVAIPALEYVNVDVCKEFMFGEVTTRLSSSQYFRSSENIDLNKIWLSMESTNCAGLSRFSNQPHLPRYSFPNQTIHRGLLTWRDF